MVEFLIRLLIAALVIWLFEKLFGAIGLNEKATRILTVVLIIVMVLFVLFGPVLFGSFHWPR